MANEKNVRTVGFWHILPLTVHAQDLAYYVYICKSIDRKTVDCPKAKTCFGCRIKGYVVKNCKQLQEEERKGQKQNKKDEESSKNRDLEMDEDKTSADEQESQDQVQDQGEASIQAEKKVERPLQEQCEIMLKPDLATFETNGSAKRGLEDCLDSPESSKTSTPSKPKNKKKKSKNEN